MNKPKTIICDIDGVLLRHKNEGLSEQLNSERLKKLLNGIPMVII